MELENPQWDTTLHRHMNYMFLHIFKWLFKLWANIELHQTLLWHTKLPFTGFSVCGSKEKTFNYWCSLCAENGVCVEQSLSPPGLSAVCADSTNVPHNTDPWADELHGTHTGEQPTDCTNTPAAAYAPVRFMCWGRNKNKNPALIPFKASTLENIAYVMPGL